MEAAYIMIFHIIISLSNSLIGLSIAVVSYLWFRHETASSKWFKLYGVFIGLAWCIAYGLVAILWVGNNPPSWYALYIVRPLITLTLGGIAMGIITRYRVGG